MRHVICLYLFKCVSYINLCTLYLNTISSCCTKVILMKTSVFILRCHVLWESLLINTYSFLVWKFLISDPSPQLYCSPHEPLDVRAVRPVEGPSDKDVKSGSIDCCVQQKLQYESRKRREGHVQAIKQVGNNEVPEL